MTHVPEQKTGPPAAVPARANPFLSVLRQPRIMLLLLGLWCILGALTEFFISMDGKIKGIFGGMALTWQSIPLAVLYFYCARDPVRYHRVFWLALIQMAAAVTSTFYHWGAGHVAPEGVIIPVAISGAIGALVFLHLFEPKPYEPGERREAGSGHR